MPVLAILSPWKHDLSPFLVQFNERFGIRYYGLAYVLGIAGAVWLLARYNKAGRSVLPVQAAYDLAVWLMIGVFVGGRLGFFLLYQPGSLLADPLVFFRVWEGGMASHGGFLGVVVVLWRFGRKTHVPFLHLSDLLATTASLGIGLGRVANFINGELWGRTTDVAWAVIFQKTGGGEMPRHPSQLYQAGLEGFLLFGYMQWRFWRSDTARLHPGQLAGEYLIGYAVLRAISEQFREPDAALILGVSRGTFYSVFLLAAGAWLIGLARKGAGPLKA
jgi:phosphatidylglycerol:prolipoprotein diacylglycerol transferase